MVEDLVFDAELIQDELRSSGFIFDVRVVNNRSQFLLVLEEFTPDLILSDFTMPGFDGLSALQLAKEKLPYVPFLFVSGTIGEERAIEALKNGATDYVLKDHLASLGPKILRAMKEAEERIAKRNAEQRLAKSENIRKLIMDSAMDAIVSIDEGGKILLWNKQAERIFGYREDEVLGKVMANYIVPHEHRLAHKLALNDYIKKVRANTLSRVIEGTAVNKTNETFPVELSIAHIKEEDEEFFCAFIRDISARKETEIALKLSEERYQKMVEEVKDYAIIFLDDLGNIQNWNEGAENIYGYREDEIVGRHFGAFFTEEEREGMHPQELLKQATARGHVSFEGWKVKKGGAIFWANVSITALHAGDNEVIGYTCVTRDLTSSKIAENKLIKYANALKESEEKYRSLFNFSPTPMWLFDVETFEFLNVNDAAIRHYGYSRSEFLNMTIMDIRPQEDTGLIADIVEQNKKTGDFVWGNYRHIKKNGELIHVEIKSNLIDFDGKMARLVLAADISDQVRYSQAIERQNRQLREIAWSQSHVVRAPLARLMGLVDLLLAENVKKEPNQLLPYIRSSADELDNIIREIVRKTEVAEKGEDDNENTHA